MQPSMLKAASAPAKACLLYRGALPVMVNATSGSIEGDVLDAVLDYVSCLQGHKYVFTYTRLDLIAMCCLQGHTYFSH